MKNSTKQPQSTPASSTFDRKDSRNTQSNVQRNQAGSPASRQPRDENGKFGTRNK